MNTRFSSFTRRLLIVAVLGVFHTIGASVSSAQVTIYAKFLNGASPWNGESTAQGRTGWAELDSISLGASIPVTIGSASGGAGVGKLVFDPIVISKVVDRLTPQIFANMASGQALTGQTNGDLTIEFVKNVGATPTVFFRVEMKLVFFTSTGSATADGDNTVHENIKMLCGAQRVTVVPIVGGTPQTPIVKSWSQVLNNSTFAVQ